MKQMKRTNAFHLALEQNPSPKLMAAPNILLRKQLPLAPLYSTLYSAGLVRHKGEASEDLFVGGE